ncbi:unnamed protein product [Urochloa humidicola]
MPTMTIPSANLRRLKKLAAEAAAKSSSSTGSGCRPRSANLVRKRSPPPVPPPRREKRVVAAAADAGGGGARFGERVLVRTPVAAAPAPLVLPAVFVRAVVVSAEDEHGYLEVVYEGAPPPGEDPFATARVPRDRVIVADTPPPAFAASSGSAGTRQRGRIR